MHLVTTNKDRRGVFAGTLVEHDQAKGTVLLKDARMAVMWKRIGVVGLAATGPTDECRITRAAPEIWLDGVTAVMLCSDQAAAAWEREPWA